MAESVVCSALRRLSILLLERETSDSMREQIQSMIKDLQSILLNLKNIVAKQDKDHGLSQWVKRVKALAYRIEDACDIFSVGCQIDGSKLGMIRFIERFAGTNSVFIQRFGGTNSVFIQRFGGIFSFSRFSTEMQDIKHMMTRLIQQTQIMYLNPYEEENKKKSWLRRTYALEFDYFVGMEEEREHLVSLLIDDGKHGQVISICGMEGIGKTAFARKLFTDPRAEDYFLHFAWVYVTQKFQPTEIWRDMVRQLSRKKSVEIDCLNDTELSFELYITLKEKKCLIVLDDVWSMDAWKRLSIIFPFGEMRSKIILTTRIREIAETVAGKRFFHLMRGLTEEESWKLFTRRLFSENDTDFVVDDQIEMIGREMVKKCGGLPPAIAVLGEIMRTKDRNVDEWQMVYRHIDAYLHEGKQYGETAIHYVLSLSYDNLPYFLKPCFLYFGLFPRGSDIDAEKLYLLWVAEGLMLSNKYGHEETNIDLAEQCLGELEQQSLVGVQEEEVPMIRRLKSCQLNKLMWDKCLLKGKEENFLKVMDYGSENRQVTEFDSITRRVTIRKSEDRDVSHVYKMDKHLWCLLLLNVSKNEEELLLPIQISNLTELNLLRILDFDGFDFTKTHLLRGIEKLVCLRYLGFKRCLLQELPSSIGKLSSLQILDLRVRSEIKMRTANVLSKLKKLMHLFLPTSLNILCGGKLQLDGLTLLETLENFNTGVCNVGDLLKLTQLRCLTTTVEGSLEDVEGIFKRINMTTDCILHSSLDIRNFDCYTEERYSLVEQLLKCRSLFILQLQGKIEHIPPSKMISHCLVEINLDGCELAEDPLTTLENLPSLRVLVLRNDAFIGEKMVCSASGFCELKRLELSNLQFLEKWLLEDGAMPKLKALIVEKCKMLAMAPDGLKFVTSLLDLKIIEMPQSFEDGLYEIDCKLGEMFRQSSAGVQHHL